MMHSLSRYNVKAITEKPSNVFAQAHRYHKRCIHCNSKWLFFTLPFRRCCAHSQYLATATCQEVFMSHGFISRFYYRVRLFNALYIKYMSAVALCSFFASLLKNHLLAGWVFSDLVHQFWCCTKFWTRSLLFFIIAHVSSPTHSYSRKI